MQTIWKFPLTHKRIQEIEMPKDAMILTLKKQGVEPCIWAIVNPKNEPEIRRFEIVQTGSPFDYDESKKYIDTILTDFDSYVFHLFELTGNKP